MLQGLYAAATGMMAVESRQDVIANNIANAATSGFRRQEPVQKGFYEVFTDAMKRPFYFNRSSAPGGGVKLVETFTDTQAGGIATTDNPMNVALSGPGFLMVETPRGERFTRHGAFAVDIDGQLATADGYKVLSTGGTPIDVGEGALSIGRDGTISIDGEAGEQLGIIEFEDPHMLTREGESLYIASEEARQASAPAAQTLVEHKALEMSNVKLPQEMVAL
ncbi:MAG: flagellar hook-basal body complex protein, partial [Nitrospiraceae bacterium]|nr:flagellar hook-basal body complex protein [Nitrospiraceae bacterium]